MNHIANTALNIFLCAVWIISYFASNLTISFEPLIKHPDLKIDIEKEPPSQSEINTAKELLRHKLTIKRNIIIPLSILITTPLLYYLISTASSTTTTYVITLVSVCVTCYANTIASQLAIGGSLEILQPLPKESSNELLEQCANNTVCDRYRLAVLSQGRYITYFEHESIKQWISKKKQREDTEGQVYRIKRRQV